MVKNAIEQVTSHVAKVAEQEGLAFNFEGQKISPNTRKAHRIITLAREDGKQVEVVEAFFKAHFIDGADLSKNENLVQLATQVGMDPARVEGLLQGNEGSAEVETAERELQQLGITGVPFYIIDNKYGLSGAQPSEVFIKAFNEAHSVQDSTAADACDVDGKKLLTGLLFYGRQLFLPDDGCPDAGLSVIHTGPDRCDDSVVRRNIGVIPEEGCIRWRKR